MPEQLGPISIECDAPPYCVVQACERIGLQSPLDVRWCLLERFLKEAAERNEPTGFASWLHPFGGGRVRETACTCGRPLPRLERYGFGFGSGKVGWYSFGQCPRCRTIFWEEG